MNLVVGQASTTNVFPCDIGARFIKWQQKTNYSHYYVYDGIDYMHSYSSGTKIESPSIFTAKYDISGLTRWYINLNKTREEVHSFVNSRTGIKYAWLQNLGLVLMDFLGFERNPFSNGQKRINCVELVALVLEFCGHELLLPADSMDLNDLHLLLTELENKNIASRM